MATRMKTCRVCDGKLEELWELGDFALCGTFPRPDEEVPVEPMGLSACKNCGLVQMHYWYPQDLYSHGYGYRSGLNPHMVKHLTDLANDAAVYAGVWAGDLVVDIGGNDGTLLRAFGSGFDKILIDPTAHKWKQWRDPSVKVIPQRFHKGLVPRKAQLVFSVAMFYDLEDPVGFAKDVSSILADDGLWVLEQSYLPSMVEANAFDTICHEHLEYYSIASLKHILSLVGLSILGIEMNDSNGGSFRVYAGKGQQLWDFTELEEWDLEWCQDMKRHFHELRQRVDIVKDWCLENVTGNILGYGASTKGNTLLQYFGLKLPAIVDVNPDKWGRVTPGTHILIVSEEAGRARKPDAYFVLPWHFKDYFLSKESTKLIFPFPEIQVYERGLDFDRRRQASRPLRPVENEEVLPHPLHV